MSDLLLATIILVAIATLLLLGGSGYVAWRVWRSDERSLAKRIGKLPFRHKLGLGRDLTRDRRVPVWARVVAVALILYLASPIDLVPDFIPLIGFLDDILIVMVGAGLLLRSVPLYVLEEHIERYEQSIRAGSATKVAN